MELERVQALVDAWIRDHGGYWGGFQILARPTEGLGEVARAPQRMEGLRPRPSAVDLEAEVGEMLFTLAAFANRRGIRLEDAFARVMQKYSARDEAPWRQRSQT